MRREPGGAVGITRDVDPAPAQKRQPLAQPRAARRRPIKKPRRARVLSRTCPKHRRGAARPLGLPRRMRRPRPRLPAGRRGNRAPCPSDAGGRLTGMHGRGHEKARRRLRNAAGASFGQSLDNGWDTSSICHAPPPPAAVKSGGPGPIPRPPSGRRAGHLRNAAPSGRAARLRGRPGRGSPEAWMCTA